MTELFDRNGNQFAANFRVGVGGKPAHRRQRSCTRCGGQGGADAWKHTGWKCYRCGGNGIDPNPEIIKLYTAEQNAKLDATAAKKAVKLAAKAAEKARLEQIRREAEKADLLARYATYIKRLEAELAFGEIEIVRSVLERMTVQVKEPSDRQVEVVEEIISRNETERARLANVGHIGEIGERRDFDLTLVYARSEQTGEFPTIWSHWSVMRDPSGNTVVSSSDPYILGFTYNREEGYKPGQTTRVKATITKHTLNKKGEPCTRIARPKLLTTASATQA